MPIIEPARHRRLCSLGLSAAACLVWGATAPVHAADDPPAAPPASRASPAAADPLGKARQHVKARQWGEATTELRRVNATGSADWNNLMGFALRKQTPPDLAAAERYYDEALRLDPRHKGALEYSGELYLMKGDLPRAEQRLASLQQVCSTPCEELDDLKKAIARFKQHGRHIPE
jgi:Flp pilus assembly protein TadD